MTLTGRSIIGNRRAEAVEKTFQPVNPATGESLSPEYHPVSAEERDAACELAGRAFREYRRTTPAARASFLRKIAEEIEALGDTLTERFVAESGLPAGRAEGERARTCGQLRLFASTIEKPDWNRPQVEQAQPDRKPLPKPDTRLRYIGVGPVAVFGPANFPLAFTVAGGDTASALAAGCPVVVKAHSSHAGVGELVGLAVQRAALATGMPDGVFSLLFGGGREIGGPLVKHPAIKAVGFTGSKGVGRSLFDLAAARPDPIPVFAEMSSINPVLVLPGALSEKAESLAEGLYGSVTLGVGQFCTNPGLVLLPPGDAADTFARVLKEKMEVHPAQTMLNRGTRQSYGEGLSRVGSGRGVETLLAPSDGAGERGCEAGPALYRVSLEDFLDQPDLYEEVFGPTTLLVNCPDAGTMGRVVEAIGGQLTISFQANEADIASHADLISDLELFAGRLVCNGFPTGVEVCATMVHGGPYPATTDARFTSVGVRAIDRFLRPVCYQGFPRDPLPEELRD